MTYFRNLQLWLAGFSKLGGLDYKPGWNAWKFAPAYLFDIGLNEWTVTNASCKYCRLTVTQIAGTDILPFTITTANGSFTLTVPSDPAADMDFRYEILN